MTQIAITLQVSFIYMASYTYNGIELIDVISFYYIFTVGLGCSFLIPNCDTWPYSCSANVSGCSYDYQARVHTIA